MCTSLWKNQANVCITRSASFITVCLSPVYRNSALSNFIKQSIENKSTRVQTPKYESILTFINCMKIWKDWTLHRWPRHSLKMSKLNLKIHNTFFQFSHGYDSLGAGCPDNLADSPCRRRTFISKPTGQFKSHVTKEQYL